MNNPKIPYNELPQLPPDFDFEDVGILKKLGEAKEALAELRGISYLFDSNISYMLLMPLTTVEAVSSSNIENIHSTIEGSFQAEVLADSEINIPDKETRNYKRALLSAITTLRAGGLQLNIELLEKIQKKIIQEELNLVPGYRKIRKDPQGREAILRIQNKNTGEILYTPPHGDMIVLDLMNNLVEYFYLDDKTDSLIKIAILHYQFEAIHPFEDGNGRVGRILFVLSLLIYNKLDIPVLYISQYLLKHKPTYYKLLREVTETGNWRDYIIFILEGIAQQARITKKVFENIKQFTNELEAECIKNKLKIKSECFIEQPYYTISQISEKSGLHRNTVIKYLDVLVSVGFLSEFKSGKEKVFYSGKFLDILSAKQ